MAATNAEDVESSGPAAPADGKDAGSAAVPESAESRPPLRLALWRYLVGERYTETVAHGLFHFTVIMLAFIIGNVWASRDAEMRDLRGQRSVLIPLSQEISHLKRRTESILAKAPAPPNGCSNEFKGHLWDFERWQSITPSDRYYLLADPDFYDSLLAFYGLMGQAPGQAKIGDVSASACLKVVKGIDGQIAAFLARITAHMQTLDRGYRGYQRILSTSHLRIFLLTLAGLGVIVVLPLVLQAAEYRLRLSRRASALGDDQERGMTVLPVSALPSVGLVRPPGESAATDDEATTPGSR